MSTPTTAELTERCNFAYPGTYGHECGSPAKWAAVRVSTMTKSGTYYGRRCDSCKAERGGENVGVIRFEVFNPERHRNEFK